MDHLPVLACRSTERPPWPRSTHGIDLLRPQRWSLRKTIVARTWGVALVNLNPNAAKRISRRRSVATRAVHFIAGSWAIFVRRSWRQASDLACLIHLNLTSLVGSGCAHSGTRFGAKRPFRRRWDARVSKPAHGDGALYSAPTSERAGPHTAVTERQSEQRDGLAWLCPVWVLHSPARARPKGVTESSY
jgi:hypothetical protein